MLIRKISILLALTFYGFILRAQVTVDGCLDFSQLCNKDFSTPVFPLTSIHVPPDNGLEDIHYGKANADYTDAQYKEADQTTNCNSTNYCSTTNYDDNLKYKVYYPTTYGFKTGCPPLPVIIFVHGGGGSDCSDFNLGSIDLNILLKYLCACGYVVVNMEYRRGRELDGPTGATFKSVQQQLNSYRSVQDIRGGIRSVIKRQMLEGQTINNELIDDDYRIDINRIFLAGNSGGALAVLSAYFYQNQSNLNQTFPHVSSSTVNIDDALGLLKSPHYFAEANDNASHNYSYFNKIKGILNLWSGLFLPNSVQANSDFASFFNGVTFPPIISFVGQKDNVFPPDNTLIYFSPFSGHEKYNKANYYLNVPPDYNDCTIGGLQFQLDPTAGGTPDIHFWGARKLYGFLQSSGINRLSELYIDCQAMHGLDKKPPFKVIMEQV